ncbi:MAG TPA: V-type ATPase 116kDa subunit family protein [Bacillota bacterium]|nr:V-type ATPase 116kDa subunit family protein [Bacillota bacterium]
MSKLTIVGLHGDRTGVLDALIKMGGVEVIEDKAEGESTRSMAYASNLDLRARLKRAVSGLSARFPEARHLVGKKLLVSEEAFAITEKDESKVQKQLNRYETLLREEEALDLSLSVLHDQAEQLMPWVDIPIDLTVRNTNKTTIIYGVFRDAMAFDAFERDVARDLPLASAFILEEDAKFPAKVAIVTINEQLPRIRARIAASDFHEIPDLPFTGSASDTMKDLDEKVTAKKDELRKVQDELREIAEGLPLLMTYHDFLLVRYDKNAADEKVHATQYTFVLKGWVPQSDAERITRELTDQYDIACLVKPAEEGEETPVKLKNNRFVSAFNVILEMYGAPNSQESDPMPVLAPFYMILFGMMLSDVGYGSMLVIMTAYMLFKKKVEGTLRQLSSMLFISGIASVVWGFVFGGFFGDLVTVVSQGKANFPMLWFNPMDSPTQLLLFSMVFGVIHLFFGMALKIRNEKLKGNLMGGLGETVPWYLIIPGLGLLLGKGSLTSEPQTALLLSNIGKGLVIAGVVFALIFAGHGIRNPFKRLMKGLGALYGITSWLSDILSYSRILALVLATSVIAAVVNMLGMLFGPTVFGYVAFTLIGVFGHTLNLGLSALSAFVHTSRLQYVELFGKFFEGGGSFWNPLRRRTEYVRIDKNAGDSVPDS